MNHLQQQVLFLQTGLRNNKDDYIKSLLVKPSRQSNYYLLFPKSKPQTEKKITLKETVSHKF